MHYCCKTKIPLFLAYEFIFPNLKIIFKFGWKLTLKCPASCPMTAFANINLIFLEWLAKSSSNKMQIFFKLFIAPVALLFHYDTSMYMIKRWNVYTVHFDMSYSIEQEQILSEIWRNKLPFTGKFWNFILKNLLWLRPLSKISNLLRPKRTLRSFPFFSKERKRTERT